MKRVPTQDCLRKSFNTHLRKMLTRRLRPKQNSLRDFSTVPFLYKPNHLQKKRGSSDVLKMPNRIPAFMRYATKECLNFCEKNASTYDK